MARASENRAHGPRDECPDADNRLRLTARPALAECLALADSESRPAASA